MLPQAGRQYQVPSDAFEERRRVVVNDGGRHHGRYGTIYYAELGTIRRVVLDRVEATGAPEEKIECRVRDLILAD